VRSSTSLLADERDRAEAIRSAGPMRWRLGRQGDGFSDRRWSWRQCGYSRWRQGAVVQSLNPRVVRPVDPLNPGADPVVATSNDFLLRLEPGVPGRAQLVAHFPQASVDQPALGIVGVPKPQVPPRRIGAQKGLARLFVRTFPLRTVSIAFHYVKTDRQGAVAPAGVRTERVNSAAEQAAWLRPEADLPSPGQMTFGCVGPNIDSNGVQAPDVMWQQGRQSHYQDRQARSKFHLRRQIGSEDTLWS
jgi:hypothetical protein